MELTEQVISTLDIPSSTELKNMVGHDSSLRNRTRFIQTNESNFMASKENFDQCTWAFNSLEKDFLEIKAACEKLSLKVKKRVQCNAYYTPSNQQGLPPHYDLHDVFVIQCEGSKLWKIWKSFRKDVSFETLQADEPFNIPAWTKAPANKELVLRPTDTIFLAAGEPHECRTTNEPSFHLSFGIYHD